MRKLIRILLIFNLIITGSHFSQDFLRSKGLQLFNETKYEAAIDSIESWLVTNKSEEGMARYFIGESYYHLSFSVNSTQSILQHLDQAIENLNAAKASSDINTRFIDKLDAIDYKLGWCYFRKAEFSFNPVQNLKQAMEFWEYNDVNNESEFETYRIIMSGLSALKIAQHNHLLIWQTENKGYANNLRNESFTLLKKANDQLGLALNRSDINDVVYNALQYSLQEVKFLSALLYLTATSEQFNNIQDPNKQSNIYQTVLYILEQQKLIELSNEFRQPSADIFQRLSIYLQARQKLLQYLISGEMENYQQLIEIIDNWATGFLQCERQFIQGMRDFNSATNDNRFLNLYSNQNNPLYKASQVKPEAFYWLGWISFLIHPPSADAKFAQFIEKSAGNKDFRIQLLLEDAKLRQLQTRFDLYMNQRRNLRQLKKDVEIFAPSSSAIESERKQLYQMIRISLGDAIWNEVLESRNLNERLDEAVELIQSFMLRATQVTGKDRELYLDFLNKMFRITAPRRNRQTTFYRGMTLFLQAEIQESANNKRRIYQIAADTLAQCEGIYVDEGLYIQGRSYFAAIKHIENETEKTETIEKAKEIFIRLINQKKSLRSLYYLAELYRIEGNHLAAIACYDKVIEFTNDKPDGLFWNKNAKAAKESCQQQGNARVLDTVQIHQVEFPDELLVIDGQVISLEKFADREYLMRDYKQEALNTWIHLGHPVLSIYPSLNQFSSSYFKMNSVENLSMQIQERLGRVTAGIRFNVLTDIDLDSVRVFINDDETVRHAAGYYEKSPLPIHHHVVIRVQVPGHYAYEKQLDINQPGIQKFVVAPVKKNEIRQISVDSSNLSIQVFDQRSDQFALSLNSGFSINKNTLLFESFVKNIKLRDIVYSESYHGFLVPNAEGEIQFFKSDPMLTPGDPLELDVPESLPGFSPEGIITDSRGNLYISDWKNHHIVVFDRNGDFVRMMGDFGVNESNDSHAAVKLQYPSRLFLIESSGYLNQDGLPVYRSNLLFVSDANGVHMIDENGNFLETIILNEMGKTDFALLSIDKKESYMKVNLYNRLNGAISCYLIQ